MHILSYDYFLTFSHKKKKEEEKKNENRIDVPMYAYECVWKISFIFHINVLNHAINK